MKIKPYEYHCEETVKFDYFNRAKECTREYIKDALNRIYTDYPNYYIYVGVTENPCGRFCGNYGVFALPFDIDLDVRASIADAMINERNHDEDFEKMFVICFTRSENDIYDIEKYTIEASEEISKERTLNRTLGGNGNIRPGKDYYFVYACITTTIPLQG